MSRTCRVQRVAGSSASRSASFVALTLFALGVSACGPDGPDADGQGARLTSQAADDLLSTDITRSDADTPLGALRRTPPNVPGPEYMTLDSLGVDFGTGEAPLRIMELYDYGCGFCRRFHQDTRPTLHAGYVDSGKVYWKSIPFITGNWGQSVPVTLAAECTRDQGRGYFEAMADLLFEHQSEWKASDEPEALAEDYARRTGVDMERFRSCFEGDELLWRVQAHTDLADQLGVRGTPTFFMVGVGPITGSLPLETFQQVFDTVLVQLEARQP